MHSLDGGVDVREEDMIHFAMLNKGSEGKESEGWKIGMALSYKRLWKLLIDRDMKRKDLHQISGVSSATLAKMSRGESVAASILDRICLSLKCDISDVVEVVQAKCEGTEDAERA